VFDILTDVVAMFTQSSHLTSPSLKLSESAGPGGRGGGSGSCCKERSIKVGGFHIHDHKHLSSIAYINHPTKSLPFVSLMVWKSSYFPRAFSSQRTENSFSQLQIQTIEAVYNTCICTLLS
jgi:hypothetical protein